MVILNLELFIWTVREQSFFRLDLHVYVKFVFLNLIKFWYIAFLFVLWVHTWLWWNPTMISIATGHKTQRLWSPLPPPLQNPMSPNSRQTSLWNPTAKIISFLIPSSPLLTWRHMEYSPTASPNPSVIKACYGTCKAREGKSLHGFAF